MSTEHSRLAGSREQVWGGLQRELQGTSQRDLISLGKVRKACWPLDANGQGALPLLARVKVWPAL